MEYNYVINVLCGGNVALNIQWTIEYFRTFDFTWSGFSQPSVSS